jgi:hypothetical protein
MVDMDLKSVNWESPNIHSDERHKRLQVCSFVFSRRFSSFSETVRFRLANLFWLEIGKFSKEDFRLGTKRNGKQLVWNIDESIVWRFVKPYWRWRRSVTILCDGGLSRECVVSSLSIDKDHRRTWKSSEQVMNY